MKLSGEDLGDFGGGEEYNLSIMTEIIFKTKIEQTIKVGNPGDQVHADSAAEMLGEIMGF